MVSEATFTNGYHHSSWTDYKESSLMENTRTSVKMESGVPQGTVLGPILFLAFINDLPEAVNSKVRLFADDCVMYRVVSSDQDCNLLQDDLDKLARWEDKWCMNFNASKCNTITITRKRKRLVHDYSLHNQILERTESATYLGVEVSPKLIWPNHINKTCAKANHTLAFLCRNLRIRDSTINYPDSNLWLD